MTEKDVRTTQDAPFILKRRDLQRKALQTNLYNRDHEKQKFVQVVEGETVEELTITDDLDEIAGNYVPSQADENLACDEAILIDYIAELLSRKP